MNILEQRKLEIERDFKIELEAIREKRNTRMKDIRKLENIVSKEEYIIKGQDKEDKAKELQNVLEGLNIEHTVSVFKTQIIFEFDIEETKEVLEVEK